MLKKVSFIFLSFALVLGFLSPASSVFADETLENDENVAREMVEVLDQYINAEDNQLEVSNIPDSIYEEFGEENIKAMLSGIEELNQEAEENQIVITDNGTIYDTDDTGFALQGGVSKSIKKWYGWAEYMSTAKANNFVYQISRVGISVGVAGAVAAFFSFGTTGILGAVSSGYLGMVALDVSYRNSGHSRGVILHITHAAAYWTQKQ